MAGRAERPDGFDRAAAVTRSLLGYGVVAGVLYLAVGVVLAATRDGFDPARHPLSLLMLGERGWLQQANLVVAGAMTVAAAIGFMRALRGSHQRRRTGGLVAVYGVALILSGLFRPDPMEGFPPGATEGDPSMTGLLHLAFGALGFIAVAAAALDLGGWFAARPEPGRSRWSRAAAMVVAVSFVGGAGLAGHAVGVVLLWVAVVTAWAWLAAASAVLYGTVPHPDPDRRTAAPA